VWWDRWNRLGIWLSRPFSDFKPWDRWQRRKAWAIAIVVFALLIALAWAGPNRFQPMGGRKEARQAIWANGEPRSKQMEQARAVVERCLGPAEEIGEAVYDYPGLTEHDVRAAAKAKGLVSRVIGRDNHCNTALASEPMRPDRLNVFLVDGRVAWAHKF
jgi:hypothetical protein